MYKLMYLISCNIDEVVVIGHSVSGVDLPYFKVIDDYTKRKCKWKVHYFLEDEKGSINKSLVDLGIANKRIELIQADEFYDLKKKDK